MLLRPLRVKHVRPSVQHVGRRAFINQTSGIQRVMRAQMAQDFRKVSTLVFLPPLMALGYITAFSICGFIGVQWWIEKVGMAPGEVTEWGWEKEMEDWSGGAKGGTDPALGIIPRIAVRSAWLFQHWASNMSQPSPSAPAFISQMFLKGPDKGFELAARQLSWVLQYAMERDQEPIALFHRYLDLLERLGSPLTLSTAWDGYRVLLSKVPANSLEQRQLALRLGNLAARMGENNKIAVRYWYQAANISPNSTPPTPIEQRLYANAIIQLSDHFSRRDLKLASNLQTKASKVILECLKAVENMNDFPIEREVHCLYLIQRLGILQLHNAEVLYAKAFETPPEKAPEVAVPLVIKFLQFITSKSTQPFSKLARGGLSTRVMAVDIPSFKKWIPPDNELIEVFAKSRKSRSLKEPAGAILRDTRRLNIHSYRLLGMLREEKEPQLAMDSYQSALEWAGMTVANGKKLGIPESEIINIQTKIDALQSRLAANL